MGTKLDVRPTPITSSVKNLLTITESTTKQYKSFLSAMITVPSMILTKTELYKKPADFFDMAALYCLSKNCKVSNIWMLPDEEHMEVDIYYIMGTVQAVLRVDVCSLVPEELRNDKHSLMTWYMYTITCLTYFSQGRTFFVHIDDDEKLKAAQQRYAEGKCVLPCNEYTYLLCLGDMPKGDFSISDNLLQPAGAGDGFLTVKTENKPVTELPSVDLNGLEDRLYDLFVYQMETQKLVGADTETTGLDIFTADLVSLGLCFNTRIGFYVSVKHTPPRQRKLVDSSTGFIPALVSLRRRFELAGGLQYVGKRGDSTKNISHDMLMVITNKLKTMDSIWHNAKFDFNIMLSNTGIRLPIWLDTMIAHYVTRPGNGIKGDMRRSLKIVACKELNVPGWAIDIVKCQAEDKDLVAAYNARDTCYMLGLAFVMAPDIAEHYDLIFNIEMKYLPILCMAERIGIRLDVKQLKSIETDLRAKADAIKAEFEAMFDPKEKFNINSNDMLKDLFYNRWGIIPPRKCKTCGVRHQQPHFKCVNPQCPEFDKEGSAPMEFTTPSGEPSMDKYVLDALMQAGVEKAKDLKEYKLANKLITSYCTLDKKVNPYDRMLHPQYNQAQTETGRLSASNPNFQQLPKKAGKYMRKCFTGKPGYCIISADYAGQEIRILAAHTRDEKLIRAYNPCYHCEHNQNGKGLYKVPNCPFEDHSEGSQCNTVDIHSYITKQVYHDKINVPIEQIKNVPEFNRMRSICKSVTFGLAYGSTAVGLANSTGIPLNEAKEVMHTYFSTFPTIKDYIEKCQLYVDKYGELVDMVGRKRLFKFAGWSIPSKANTYYSGTAENERGFHYPERMFAKEVRKNLREATNFPIQGLAASMTKIAAINIDRMFREAQLDAWLIEFVHDEVVVTCPKDEDTIRRVIDIITEGMEKSIDIPSHCIKNHPLGWSWPDYIPMKVEVEVGDSYGSIMEPEEYYKQLNAEEAALAVPVTHEVELLDDDESEQFGVETI